MQQILDSEVDDNSIYDASDYSFIYTGDVWYYLDDSLIEEVAAEEDLYYVDIQFDSSSIFDAGELAEDISSIPELTPESIGFENVEIPPIGSLIFYNNWALDQGKDSIEMINEDGTYRGIRLYANRVWSFGVSRDGSLIVFSTNDPYQSERYGIDVYDAIENSWLVKRDGACLQISFGPVNDECHQFVTDDILLMCRRANFRPDPNYLAISDPYRILRHNIKTGEEVYLTPLDNRFNDYSGTLRDDGIILFNRNIIADRTIDIMSLDPSSGNIELVLKDSSFPVISPDGKEVLFKKKGSNKVFIASSYNLSESISIIDGGSRRIGRYVFSPDGRKIAYTIEDGANNCSDLMIYNRDTQEAKKILDCADDKKFITVINWVQVIY